MYSCCLFKVYKGVLTTRRSQVITPTSNSTSLTPAFTEVAVSTSKRKLSSIKTTVEADVNATQNILTNTTEIIRLVKTLHSNCGEIIVESCPANQGVFIPWKVRCTECEFTHILNTSNTRREGKNMNMAAVFGTISSGFDKTNIDNFLCCLGLKNLPDSFYDMYMSDIHAAVTSVLTEIINENREYVKRHYPDGQIAIKFDG